MEGDLHKELEIALNHLESYSTKNINIIHKSVMNSLVSLSQMILKGIYLKFKSGWMRTFVDRYNHRLFNNNESDIIEHFFDTFVKPFFGSSGSQKGGVLPKPEGSFWNFMKAKKEISNSEKIQRDMHQIINKLSCYARTIQKDFGLVKYFYGPPEDPNMLPIPFMIRGIVEAIRLILTYTSSSPIISRVTLSVVLAIIDFLDGKSNESLLSLAGVLGNNPLILGLIMKVVLAVFSTNDQESSRSFRAFKDKFIELTSPVTEKILVKTQGFLNKTTPIVQGSFKNALAASGPAIAYATSAASTAASDITNKVFSSTSQAPPPPSAPPVDNIDLNADDPANPTTPTANPTGAPANPTVQSVSEIDSPPRDPKPMLGGSRSIKDIESQDLLAAELHRLIHTNPSIICSSGFQTSIKSLQNSPFLCIYLEILGIPTDLNTLTKYCESLQTQKISRKTRKRRITPN